MTPLVLLPGMMCDARLFTPQIAAFSRRWSIFCAPLSRSASITGLASDILSDAPPRFALAGLSMGGIVAMEMLRQAPGRIDRIALLDTNPFAEIDAVKARRFRQMWAVENGELATVMREEMKPNYLSTGPRHEEILTLCMEMALDFGPHVFLTQSRALMDRADQIETLRQTNLPALVLCGRDDMLCPVSRHEMMADQIPGAQLEVVDGAGHLPTLEQPEITNAALARWLED
ncbi:MAG: alpha/beta fold hydrolase [Rhodobacteraceae bacterium]|nr:alpha/beta fold hydrolase [Paracoccaceae bacterium]